MRESPQTCVADSADARHYIDSLKAAGADMIKPRFVKREMYFVIAAESRRLGIPFGGHAQEETAIEASDSGASIVDHMQYFMGARGIGALCWGNTATVEQCQPVAERFKHNETWFVPTLTRDDAEGQASYAQPTFARFAHSARAFWAGSLLHGNWLRDSATSGNPSASHRDSVGAMQIMRRVGLPILSGTDDGAPVIKEMPPGFSLHAELAMYGAEGLTPLEALQTATLNPAKFLHATDSLGTVATGKLADLVLLDADPLTDITNTTTIRAVVANGRYFDRATLDQLLTKVQSKAK
jgi:imidazolonepropionase-like amidohydrolase